MQDKAIQAVVVGLGYVGAPCAYFLAKTAQVTAIDLDPAKLAKVRAGQPLLEPEHFGPLVEQYAKNLTAAESIKQVEAPDFVFLNTPTNADPETGELDTTGLETLIAECLAHAPKALIVIRSTIPVGFTARIQADHPEAQLVFWPEFVRESRAYEDNLKPDRVIFGGADQAVARLRSLVQSTFAYPDELLIEMGSGEAELVKLASNAYLATRVAFMNEVDTLSRNLGLNPGTVNAGVCADKRIGSDYANPSLGFGGYCLPKDTLQFASLDPSGANQLARAALASNEARMDSFVKLAQQRGATTVGFFRLVMKPGSDNARESASVKIAERLEAAGIRVLAFEPQTHLVPDFIEAVDADTLFAQAGLVLAESWRDIPPAQTDKVVCPDLRGL